MKHFEQSKMDKELVIEREFNRKVRMMSTHLLTSLKINPFERQLVQAGRDKTCSDNAEMVYSWVKQQACCASCIREMSFQKLQKDFVNELLNLAKTPVSNVRGLCGSLRIDGNVDSSLRTQSSQKNITGAVK
jgi:hypothetical protein